jgi:hypothetical protein
VFEEKSHFSKILEKNKNNLFNISINCYGTRALQKILDYTNSEKDFQIIKDFLKTNIYNLIKDINGNHVIQKILLIFPQDKNTFIMDEISQNIVEISKIKQGSCIFQKVLDVSLENDKVNLINYFII